MGDEIGQVLQRPTQKLHLPPPPLHGSSEAIAASELRRDTVGSGCRKTGQAAMCRVNLRGGADVPEVGRPERLGAHPDQGR